MSKVYREYLDDYNAKADQRLKLLKSQGWNCHDKNRPDLTFGDEYREYYIQIHLDWYDRDNYKVKVRCRKSPYTDAEKTLYDTDILIDRSILFDNFASQIDNIIDEVNSTYADIIDSIEEARAKRPKMVVTTFRVPQSDLPKLNN